MMVKFCDQPVDVAIGPMIESICAGQLWERGLHCCGLFGGPLFDTVAMIRRERGESLAKDVDVEECDWKRADAAAGAAKPAGDFTEQSGGGAPEPVVGFLIERGWA
jgi:hypothetical protein